MLREELVGEDVAVAREVPAFATGAQRLQDVFGERREVERVVVIASGAVVVAAAALGAVVEVVDAETER